MLLEFNIINLLGRNLPDYVNAMAFEEKDNALAFVKKLHQEGGEVYYNTKWGTKIKMPNHHSRNNMKIARGLVAYLKEAFNECVILEFGSGEGTKELMLNGHLVMSIEDKEEWVGKYHDFYIHAPLVYYEDTKRRWYDIDMLGGLDRAYDIILIDGPSSGDRLGFLDNTHLFDMGVTIVVDDIDRPDGKLLFDELKKGRVFASGGHSYDMTDIEVGASGGTWGIIFGGGTQ